MGKLKLGIIFGGRSGEHEVSLQSAKNIVESVDREKFEPVLIGIDKAGGWFLFDEGNYLLNPEDPAKIRMSMPAASAAILPVPGSGLSIFRENNVERMLLDVVFPVIHGTFGEDGTLQGLLELAEIPYVGPDVLGSAACMDKITTKRILRDSGFDVAEFVELRTGDFESGNDAVELVEDNLHYPVFVKPANLGSSVGISKAKDRDGLTGALKTAFQFDVKVLVEEFVKGREIEVAVLGNDNPSASIAGEIIPQHEFYTYEAKYLDEKGARLDAPAKIDDELSNRMRQEAIRAFLVSGCSGMARIDYLWDEENTRLVVNEINTIPGFTKISMYPRLWDLTGIPYGELIEKLALFGMERMRAKKQLRRAL